MEKYVRSYSQDRGGDIIKVSIYCFLRIKIDRVRCAWVRRALIISLYAVRYIRRQRRYAVRGELTSNVASCSVDAMTVVSRNLLLNSPVFRNVNQFST